MYATSYCSIFACVARLGVRPWSAAALLPPLLRADTPPGKAAASLLHSTARTFARAADYVTNADRLAEPRRALVVAPPDKKTPPPFFEALISLPVENYVPGAASLVAAKSRPY
jgi:hypothetical protein